jgi:hypothetical protein
MTRPLLSAVSLNLGVFCGEVDFGDNTARCLHNAAYDAFALSPISDANPHATGPRIDPQSPKLAETELSGGPAVRKCRGSRSTERYSVDQY